MEVVAVAYLLLLPTITCTVLLLLLLLPAVRPSKAKATSDDVGVGNLPLPPAPPTVPIVGPLLWLWRARSRLEPAIRELHRRHGPVLTLGFLSPRPAIFVSGRGATHRALVQRGPAFASRPPAIAPFRVLSSDQRTVSSAPYGPLWRSLRRNLTAGVLHPSRVRLFAPARRWALALLASDLERSSASRSGGGEVTVVECLQFAMFSLLTHMCFGQWLPAGRVREIEAVQRELFSSYISFQTAGKEDGSLEYCYIDTLLAHKLPKEAGDRALTDDEMVSLCTEFLTASVDTTVTALQWIMANLVKQPRIQERLLDEINAVVAEADRQSMPYLKAVVLEGLRRHPPAHFLLSHAAVEETSLDGFRVPAARSVNFSVGDISLDEGAWDRPEEFRPERFVDGGEGAGVDLTGSRDIKMMPFGVGRRICPGLGLALLHLEYFVANMVRGYEWAAVPGDGVDLAERPEFTVTMERPLRVRVARRGASSLDSA